MSSAPVVGIDWSVTSPGICINEGKIVHFYFFSHRKMHHAFRHNVIHNDVQYFFTGLDYPEFEKRESRYDDLANSTVEVLEKHGIAGRKVFIEGFAFSASGRGVSALYESGGIIRNKLYANKIEIEEIPPTSLKKSATGKGNANKLMMYRSFEFDTGINMFVELKLSPSTTIPKPVEDLVDAYYLTVHDKNKMRPPEVTKQRIADSLIGRLNGPPQKDSHASNKINKPSLNR